MKDSHGGRGRQHDRVGGREGPPSTTTLLVLPFHKVFHRVRATINPINDSSLAAPIKIS